MKTGQLIVTVGVFFLMLAMISRCSSSSNGNQDYAYQEEGLDKVIKQHMNDQDYTVILADMNYEDPTYYHKYQVIVPLTDTTFDTQETEWLTVSPMFFESHKNALGMEVASKTNGVLEKSIAPAGYSQYIGNEKYGRWKERDGGSFWEFYGKYAFMSNMFHLMTYPARYGYYNNYYNSYRGRGAYYGPNGYYGTSSYSSSNAGRNTTWGQKPQSFKDRVNSRVSRSSKTQRSRNSSRYSKSSTRSRSGGFGK